jgi:hypothetical protein
MDPSIVAPHIDTSVGDMASPSDYSEGMADSPTMAEMGDSLKLFVGQVSRHPITSCHRIAHRTSGDYRNLPFSIFF